MKRILGSLATVSLIAGAALVAVGVAPAAGVPGAFHPRLQINAVVNGGGTFPEGSLQVHRECAPAGNATSADSGVFTVSTVDLMTGTGSFLSSGQSCSVSVVQAGGMKYSISCTTANAAMITCSPDQDTVTWVKDDATVVDPIARTATITVTFDPPPTDGLVECAADPFGANVSVPVSTQALPQVWCAELTVEKQVVGDEPDVKFPIVVSCTTIDSAQWPPVGTTAILDPGDEGDGSKTQTVELGDGDSTTFQIPVLTVWSESFATRVVDCSVSEDPADADLPSGWECDVASIEPDDAVTLGTTEDIEVADQSATVVVTNECAAPPEAAPAAATATPVPAAAIVARPAFTG